jgi:hypothetical protein
MQQWNPGEYTNGQRDAATEMIRFVKSLVERNRPHPEALAVIDAVIEHAAEMQC